MDRKYQLRHSLYLFIAAVVWGISFVSQRSAMQTELGGFTFNGIRLMLGALVLVPIIFVIRKKDGISKWDVEKKKSYNKYTIIGGIVCGLVLCLASNLQQFGIKGMSAGKTGFMTAMYIIEVPMVGLLLRKKTSWLLAVAVPLAVGGMFLLCMVGESFAFGISETLVLCCSFVYTLHIMVIDYFAPKSDNVAMSCIQFAVAGIISLILMFIFETPKMDEILACKGEILYAGIGSCSVAYTLQIVGQKNMNSTVSALILSLESTVSVLSGWIILHETLSIYQALGCVLMFIAIIVAQLPKGIFDKFKKNKVAIIEEETKEEEKCEQQ